MTSTAAVDLTWDQALVWRVGQHRLATPPGEAADPVELAAHLAGVQAQVQSSVARALAVRGAADLDLDRLLWRDRVLVSHRAHTIPEGRVDAVSRSAGWISPVLLVDGRIVGTWEADASGDATTVTVTPFSELPAPVVEAARAHLDDRYPRVLGPHPRLAVA